MKTAKQRAAKRIKMKRKDLESSLTDMVESGDLTNEQANQWINDKVDKWNLELNSWE